MKKIFLILIALFTFATIYAQDKEPEQHKFIYPAISEVDSVYLSDTLDYFKQKEFMLGWHWGASKKISKALCMNQIDAHSDKVYDTTEINANTLIILKSVINYDADSMQFYTHCDNATQLIRAKAIYYEPTLQVSSIDTLNTENYDNMNPIFGFKVIKGRVENNATDNRSRLVLDSAALNGQVVLDEPWMSGNLFRHDKSTKNPNFSVSIGNTETGKCSLN